MHPARSRQAAAGCVPHGRHRLALALWCLAALLLLHAPLDARAAPAARDPLFSSIDTLSLELEGPLRAIAADRAARPEERPVIMRWVEADGTARELEIDVRARGRSRRDPARCAFPPLRLDLPRSRVASTLFEGQDKIKLVSHCQALGSRAKGPPSWVRLEYFAYRILARLTDASFGVRLLDVTWIDEHGERFRHPAFLIEAEPRLAARLGVERAGVRDVDADALDPEAAQLAELFQYSIGGTDFSFTRAAAGEETCCHNALLFGPGGGAPYLPVPYDFDVTGLVDPAGAIPAPGLGIRRVSERVWLGSCRPPGALEAAMERFRAARADIASRPSSLRSTACRTSAARRPAASSPPSSTSSIAPMRSPRGRERSASARRGD